MKHEELINALTKCAISCRHCAFACLLEKDVAMMAECIRTDILCADVCELTIRTLLGAKDNEQKNLLAYCRDMCDSCAAECSRHEHEHCQACAASCRACMEACRKYLN